jgi:hypothetical protein
MAMNVAIEIPENVSAPLRSSWNDVPRRVLEAVAADFSRISPVISGASPKTQTPKEEGGIARGRILKLPPPR